MSELICPELDEGNCDDSAVPPEPPVIRMRLC